MNMENHGPRFVDYDGTVILRKARTTKKCVSCERENIAPGKCYLEYVGEVPAFATGDPYCMDCGMHAWSSFMPDVEAVWKEAERREQIR